jgi:hypothetical protein
MQNISTANISNKCNTRELRLSLFRALHHRALILPILPILLKTTLRSKHPTPAKHAVPRERGRPARTAQRFTSRNKFAGKIHAPRTCNKRMRTANMDMSRTSLFRALHHRALILPILPILLKTTLRSKHPTPAISTINSYCNGREKARPRLCGFLLYLRLSGV